MQKQRPPQIKYKKQGRFVYLAKKGKDGYKDDAPSDSDLDRSFDKPTSHIFDVESDISESMEPCSLRVKAWDKDIRHVQQIATLLKAREKFFSGQLDETCYQTGPNGNPLFFPGGSRVSQQKIAEKSHATSQMATAASPTPTITLKTPQTPDKPSVRIPNSAYLTSEEEEKQKEKAKGKDKLKQKKNKEESKEDGEEEEIKVIHVNPATKVESEHEFFKNWKNRHDPEEKYNHVKSWVASSIESMKTFEKEDDDDDFVKQMRLKNLDTFSKPSYILNKSEEILEQYEKAPLEKTSNRFLRATLSSALKSTCKFDPHNFLGKKALRSDMIRCGIKDVGTKNVNRDSLEGARILLRQAEKEARATETREMLRYRKEPLGYMRMHRKVPVVCLEERSASDLEESMLKTFAKPFPRSTLDFSHGDGVLQQTFSLIKVDPTPIIKLKSKGGQRKGVIVPKMEYLRLKAKLHTEARRSENELLGNLITSSYNRFSNRIGK